MVPHDSNVEAVKWCPWSGGKDGDEGEDGGGHCPKWCKKKKNKNKSYCKTRCGGGGDRRKTLAYPAPRDDCPLVVVHHPSGIECPAFATAFETTADAAKTIKTDIGRFGPSEYPRDTPPRPTPATAAPRESLRRCKTR